MNASLPPPPYDKDREHLRLLGIFSLVIAGLGVFGLLFLVMHYFVMNTVMDNPEMWKKMQQQPNAPPFNPELFFNAFRYVYLFIGAWGFASVICNAIAGFCLLKQRDRMFCLVVAGFNCINFPFGTALGIFTLLVLLRDSVRLKFEAATG